MFNLPDLRIDRPSFWLGFLTASLVWWLLGRIRPLLPVWRDQFRQWLDAMRQKNMAGVEEFLRRETIRRAQSQHLASPLFSLDEILIQPWLLAPPQGQDPSEQVPARSIASQVIPYLPDSPEITSHIGVPRLKPAQALHNGMSIAIIGQPGTGKTVALCHLACQIARQEDADGTPENAIPILLHILDLDTSLEEGGSPLDNIIRSVASQANLITQRQFPGFLHAVLRDKQRRVVLLLDGLDEIPPEKLDETSKFLHALHNKHPRLQMVVTASSDYVDGLSKVGFYPLGITAWGKNEREALSKKWSELWDAHLGQEISKTGEQHVVDSLLFQNWIGTEKAYATPLEWTLRLWGAYAGDLSGSRPTNILEAYLSRFLPGPSYISALEELAHHMVSKTTSSLSYNEMERLLSRSKIEKPAMPASDPSSSTTEEEPNAPDSGKAKKPRNKGRRDLITSQGEQIITRLENKGIFIEHSNGQIRFSSPVLLGFLSGMKTTPEEAAELTKQLNWTAASQTLQFAASCTENGSWILPLIEDSTAPLYHDLLIAARWLRDAPPQAAWRSTMMRTLVSLIQKETLPLSIRVRMVNAFYLSRDPSIPKLLKQLLVSRSPVVKRAALIGCGALGNAQMINDILELLADHEPQVRYTACLALAAIPGETALNTIVEILLTSDEELRQASAEALAQNNIEGYKVLEEAATVDDLLVRRASVFGLLQISESWSHQLIEKLAIEDGQWVVRNAAAQALEVLKQTNPAIPSPLAPPSESPWLITFASKLGRGLLPGQPATEVLLEVLKSGSVEEQTAALYYLRNQPEDGVINAIYHLVYGMEDAIHEPAIQSLWWMQISGMKLPDPIGIGLG